MRAPVTNVMQDIYDRAELLGDGLSIAASSLAAIRIILDCIYDRDSEVHRALMGVVILSENGLSNLAAEADAIARLTILSD